MIYATLSADQLVRACSQSGDAEAWHEFVCRFQKMISVVIWRVAQRYSETSHAVIEDLVQETYIKVCVDNCRLLREFQPHHPDAFFGMLKVTATNVAHDYFRARQSDKRGSGRADSELSEVETLVSSSSSGPEQIERAILLEEIEETLRSLTADSSSGQRDREIFWLHYRQGLTAGAIAGIRSYQLTDKGVESILHRLKGQLRARLAADRMKNETPESGVEGISAEKTLFKREGQT